MIRALTVTGMYGGDDEDRRLFAFYDTVRDALLGWGWNHDFFFESIDEWEESATEKDPVDHELVTRCRRLIPLWVPQCRRLED